MKKIKLIIKLFIVSIVIYLLFQYNIVETVNTKILYENISTLLIVIALMIFIILLGSYKWWLLLKSQNYNIPLDRAYLIYSSGLFFNIFMPGAAGGDLIKGYYLYTYIKKSQRTSAIFTIIIDRVIGLHALLSISFLSLVYYFYIHKDWLEFKSIFISIGFLIVFSIIIYYLILYFLENIKSFLRNNKFKKINFITVVILKILESLESYRSKKIYIVKCWLISLVNHLLMISCFLIIAGVLNLQYFNFTEISIIGSLSLVANTVPLTPGGIGIGESAFNYFGSIFHSSNRIESIAYGSIFFITYRILFNIVCLIGSASLIILKKPRISYEHE